MPKQDIPYDDGIVLIDKPAGWTSFDVVNRLRFTITRARDVKPKSLKVGHAGTLDPFATGLLIILIGKLYTKQADTFLKLDKVYEATLCLGKTSTTGDLEGEITIKNEVVPKKETIIECLKSFIGNISQTPPAFSAIKINGQRAYELARAGKQFELAPRQVTIYKLELISYNYPVLTIKAHVSSGTYIRTLAEDIGQKLGTGAYCQYLRRTKIGDYDIRNASSLPASSNKLQKHL